MPYAPDEARAPARLPRQPKEIHARLRRYAALVPGLAVLVERIYPQPAVVERVPGRPDDRRDAGGGEVQFEDRIRHAFGVRAEDAGLGFLGQSETVSLDVVVGLVEHGQVVGVAA